MSNTFPIVQALCKAFIERAEHLDYRGKKRDNAALDYLCGAASSAQLAGNETLANHLGKIVWIVSVRGFMEVKHIASMPTKVVE